MTWYNPFSWFGEDKVTRCGWYLFSVYRNPRKDPYYNFCSWDDNGTSNGSYASRVVPLDRWIEQGVEQIKLIQSKYEPGTFEHGLGDFYAHVWPKLVPLFWEGKQ